MFCWIIVPFPQWGKNVIWFNIFSLLVAALTLVNLVEKTLDWDLAVTAIMSTLLKYGFSKGETEMVILHIFMICMRKQWGVLGTCLFRNQSPMDWFLSGNCLMDLKVLLVQKWITWYMELSLGIVVDVADILLMCSVHASYILNDGSLHHRTYLFPWLDIPEIPVSHNFSFPCSSWFT